VASGTVDDHTFDTHGECVACHLVGLSNNADNTATITYWATAAEAKTVGLSGRTLYRDNSWNTLCLPFSMTAEQVTAQLAPVALRELDTDGIYDADKHTGFDPSDGTLYLYFKPATTIEAGKPYLVKWTESDDWENPCFTGITIDNSTAAQARQTVTSADGILQFIGTYAPVPLAKNDQSNLFLGAGDKLFWPSVANYQLGAFRAHFHVDLAGAVNVRSFVLHFGAAAAGVTGITTTNYTNYTNSDAWYTLDGRKIVNGQWSMINGQW
jgi:hypothetical protein